MVVWNKFTFGLKLIPVSVLKPLQRSAPARMQGPPVRSREGHNSMVLLIQAVRVSVERLRAALSGLEIALEGLEVLAHDWGRVPPDIRQWPDDAEWGPYGPPDDEV